MSDPLKMSYQPTLLGLIDVISSAALQAGTMHSTRPDTSNGIASYGRGHVPVNLSARQAKEKGLLTSGTYGQRGSGSSSSVDLMLSLANRLRERTDALGSTLFNLIWKQSRMRSGRSVYVLRALVRRTSERDFSSWPTPTVNDAVGSGICRDWGPDLVTVASWATPTGRDYKDGACQKQIQEGTVPINSVLERQVLLTDSGKTPNGFTVGMESTGRLNPAFSRWLQAYPPEWDDCAVTAMPLTHKSP